jgi:transposase
MAQPIAPDYGQVFLFPPALEDWVGPDHPARFLREFVDQLDLVALGFVMPAATEGRPGYHPSLLLKIWLYGYFHRIRSTRKLEASCRDHVPLMWLSGLIAPDHNSLWRFWDNNKKALRAIFKQTVQLAINTGAVGFALQALDGTKIQAACSGPKGWRKKYMEQLQAQLDAALEQIEVQVVEENTKATEYRLPEGLAQRQALREEIKKGLAQLENDGRNHYHPAEPQARRMKTGDTNRYAYNAQAIADEKEKIIVACEVTQEETDNDQMVAMIEQAGENLGQANTAQTVTLADSGYGNGAELQAANDKGYEVLAPPAEGKPAQDNPYARQHFNIDPVAGKVICPQGKQLDYEGKTTKRGQIAAIARTVQCGLNVRTMTKVGR